MFKNNLTALLLLFTLFSTFSTSYAQNSLAAVSSEITSVSLPKGAERLLPEKVPAEFNQAFDNLLKEGAGKITGGEREVLAWLGNYKNGSAAKITQQIQTNFRNAGWQYETAGQKNEVEFFSLLKDGSPHRAIMGFFVSGDDVVVCALMEVVQANSPVKSIPAKTEINQPIKTNSSAKIVTVDRDTNWINVMGNEMPPMPSFPQLAPKPGKVRGYVKDWSGKPLAGAEIGIRASYFAGSYSGGQGKTDANGYYDLAPPKGMAHFYNAGYQIEYGDGVAAVSLHPADGKLDSFVTTDGAVENFVLLPYGITSRENLQQSSHLPSTFYGGAIFFNWYGVEANDNNAPAFALREGSLLEITLTPEGKMLDGSAGQTIVIRKTLGASGGFRVHNIPLGRYRISVEANGKSLKVKDTQKFDRMFGMSPAETTGEASILFVPDQAKASMVGPQNGAWKWISLSLETP